jgi:hypothetical protein
LPLLSLAMIASLLNMADGVTGQVSLSVAMFGKAPAPNASLRVSLELMV